LFNTSRVHFLAFDEVQMSHWITLVTGHGPMNGWIAEPDDKPVGGIVLVHEIFGVNADMRKIAERYAASGYLTVVPALFDKVQPEVELDDYAPDDYQRGNELSLQLGVSTATELVVTAADAIGHAGDIAIIGHGWGGSVALLAARKLAVPCVIYYGTHTPASPDNGMNAPVLIHYGTLDPQYSSDRPEIPGSGTAHAQVFSYPTGHAFDREGDTSHYHAQSSEQAFQRTMNFLDEYVRGPGE
jgi:carboxymethylenebutenolidase